MKADGWHIEGESREAPIMRALFLGDLGDHTNFMEFPEIPYHAEFETLKEQMVKTIKEYETATNPKDAYKAGERVNLIAKRLEPCEITRIIGQNAVYQPEMEKYETGKVPQLKTIDDKIPHGMENIVVFKPVYVNSGRLVGVAPEASYKK